MGQKTEVTKEVTNKLEITEEQKHAFLDAIQEVEKKHGLQLCAVLHRVETQLKSSHEALLAIRLAPPVTEISKVEAEHEQSTKS